MSHVLIVEDEPLIRELIADELHNHGYSVEVAQNGEEALHCLEQSRPDVIVLDLMLPVMHGWDFIERYGQRTAGGVIPIVVVSAAKAVPRSYEALGVCRFLAKPFRLDELAASVRDLVSSPASGTPSAAPITQD